MLEARDTLGYLIGQVRSAMRAELWLVALIAALALPDMASGLEADDGRTTGPMYRSWLVRHAGRSEEDAKFIWRFRSSLLHQGSTYPHGGGPPVAMMDPSAGVGAIHQIQTTTADGRDPVYWLSLVEFVEELLAAVEAWVDRYGQTSTVQRNLAKFVRRRPEGLPPYVGDAAVFG